MAALPARLRALALVPRPPGRLSGPPAQGHDRGPGAKAPDRALAIPPGRGRAARDGAEASLTERRLQRHGARDTGRRSTGECGSTDRARPAKRSWSGGAEGAVAVMRRGLPDSADDIEWRRSPRSSSDPNKGSWRGRHPAGYEDGEGTLAVRSSTSAPTDANTRGNGTMPTSTQ